MTILEPFRDSRSYNFSITSGSGVSADLSASGAGKILTFDRLPFGLVAGSGQYVYLSDGTGAAEAVVITAVSGSGGDPGTITITTANTHTDLWVVSSATAGVQEAQNCCTDEIKQVFMPGGTLTFHAPVYVDVATRIFGSGQHLTFIYTGLTGVAFDVHLDYTFSFSEFSIQSGGTLQTSGCGIKINGSVTGTYNDNFYGSFYHLYTYNIHTPILYQKGYAWSIKDCKFVNFADSAIVIDNGAGNDAGAGSIIGCQFDSFGNWVSISTVSKAAVAIVTSVGHGLTAPTHILISGATGTGWTAINSDWTATPINANTFSIPIDSTLFGTLAGTVVFTLVARCGIDLISTGGMSVIGCSFGGAMEWALIKETVASSGLIFVGNDVENTINGGIKVFDYFDRLVISGNTISQYAGVNTWYAVFLVNCPGASITGNHIITSRLTDVGVYVDAGSTGVCVTGNFFRGFFYSVQSDGECVVGTNRIMAVAAGGQKLALSAASLASLPDGGIGFSGIGAWKDGSVVFCPDGTVTSGADNTLTSGGTGALAVKIAGVWRAFKAQN